MLVKSMASTNYFSQANSVKRKDNEDFGEKLRKKRDFGQSDTYISSNSSKDISEIKNKIASGFYNSGAVNDDLTEAFSQLFKKAFSWMSLR